FTMIGTQWSGPVGPDCANLASSASAVASAPALTVTMAFSAGPFLSYASMRSRYIWTSTRHVSVRALSAAWISAMVASSVRKSWKASASAGAAGRSPRARTSNGAIDRSAISLIATPPVLGRVTRKHSGDYQGAVRAPQGPGRLVTTGDRNSARLVPGGPSTPPRGFKNSPDDDRPVGKYRDLLEVLLWHFRCKGGGSRLL